MMERTRGRPSRQEERQNLRRERLGKMAKGYRIKLLEVPEGAEQILDL